MSETPPPLRFVPDVSKAFRTVFKIPKTATPATIPAPVDKETAEILAVVARREEAES